MQSFILALVCSWAEAWLKADWAEKGDLQDVLIELKGRLFNWSRMLHRVASISAYQIGSAWICMYYSSQIRGKTGDIVTKWWKGWMHIWMRRDTGAHLSRWGLYLPKTDVKTKKIHLKWMNAQECEFCSTITQNTCASDVHTSRKTRNTTYTDLKVLTCHIAKKIRDTQRTRDSM